MAQTELGDIIPRAGSFSVPRGESEKTFHLRPFNLVDELWLKETFGKRLEEVFKDGLATDFVRIAYHQLVPEDQAEFTLQKVTIIDEEGKTEVLTIGGIKLLQAQISGQKAKNDLVLAVCETLGVSRPIIDKARSEGNKKKVPIGPTSSTPSQPNTAGRRNTSSRARNAK